MQLEQQPDREVVEVAAVQDERDERRQPALTGRGCGFGPVGVHLTENFKHDIAVSVT